MIDQIIEFNIMRPLLGDGYKAGGIGTAGLAGFIVLLIMDVFLYLYDKYINKEKVFATVL